MNFHQRSTLSNLKSTGIVLSAFSDGFKIVKKVELMKKIKELDKNGVFNNEEKALIKEYKQIKKDLKDELGKD